MLRDRLGPRGRLARRDPREGLARKDRRDPRATPGRPAPTTQQVGPAASQTFESLSLTGAVNLNAGDSLSVSCADSGSNHSTEMGEGDLNAVLISSSKGTSAAVQPASRKLTIVRP